MYWSLYQLSTAIHSESLNDRDTLYSSRWPIYAAVKLIVNPVLQRPTSV